jgi:hypothetical protein
MRGSGDPRLCSRIVSIAGSRQAARGPSRPGAKSLWITRMGLALLRESAGGVKERRKPDRWWQSREIGGGLPQTGRVARAALLGSTCRGKALWVGKVALIDEGAAEAILAPHERHPGDRVASGGATGSVRGRSPALCVVDNAKPRVAPPQGGARHPPSRKAKGAVSDRPKLETRRQACAQPGLDHRKVVWRRTEEPGLRVGEASCVSAARAARPEVERSTGARVVSRLQRSARSIFFVPSRGAARQTEVACSSAGRPLVLTGRTGTLRAKGCEDFRANVTGNAKGFARS